MQRIFSWGFLFFATSLFSSEEELSWNQFAPPSVQEYNSFLQSAVVVEDWWAVVDFGDQILKEYPKSPFAEEAPFLMGKAYLQMDQLLLANECFTKYLSQGSAPKHFEEVIHEKFLIAESLHHGKKIPLFGSHKMPKWASGKEEAITVYDEVIVTLPHSEIGAKSLLGKALLQKEFEDYKPAIETLDLLIQRFPKHDLAAEAYLEKGKLFLLQAQNESPDDDLLDLAEINLRKFTLDFPREPRLETAQERFCEMQEVFAQNLLDIGKFYEKTKKKAASRIYYTHILTKYPATEAAQIAKERLAHFEPVAS